MKKIGFIEKKWLVIILLVSLIEPLHYFLLLNYPLSGKTFMAYDSDEALNSGMMRSIELGFDNPWSPGEKVFFNGAIGSPYPYLALGYLRWALGIDALLMNIIAKAVLFFVFLLVLFKTMEAIMPRRHGTAFLFFVVPLGLMPLGYSISAITGIEKFAEGFSFEFSVLNNFSRIYYFAPLISAFLSLFFFSKSKRVKSAICLGATFILYPFFGFAFSGLLFLYSVSGKNGKMQEKFRQTVNEVWKTYAIALIFLLPWIYIRFGFPNYFDLYSQNSYIWRAHIVSIVGSYFFILAIIFIANINFVRRYWKFFVPGTLIAIAVIIAELKDLMVPPFSTLAIPSFTTDFTELLILFVFGAGLFILDSNLDRRHKFILLFAAAFLPLSIFNPKYAFWMQYRMGYILHIPLAMLAALYFDRFMDRVHQRGLAKKLVLAFLIVMAFTSFLAYNYRFQMSQRWQDHVYLYQSDKDAMLFLDKQPKGIVLAADKTMYFMPTWSGQYVLYHPAESQYLGGGPDRLEKKSDTALFYSADITSDRAREILQDYNGKYVFYGSEEKGLGNRDLQSYTFLKKIYDSGTQVYAVEL